MVETKLNNWQKEEKSEGIRSKLICMDFNNDEQQQSISFHNSVYIRVIRSLPCEYNNTKDCAMVYCTVSIKTDKIIIFVFDL